MKRYLLFSYLGFEDPKTYRKDREAEWFIGVMDTKTTEVLKTIETPDFVYSALFEGGKLYIGTLKKGVFELKNGKFENILKDKWVVQFINEPFWDFSEGDLPVVNAKEPLSLYDPNFLISLKSGNKKRLDKPGIWGIGRVVIYESRVYAGIERHWTETEDSRFFSIFEIDPENNFREVYKDRRMTHALQRFSKGAINRLGDVVKVEDYIFTSGVGESIDVLEKRGNILIRKRRIVDLKPKKPGLGYYFGRGAAAAKLYVEREGQWYRIYVGGNIFEELYVSRDFKDVKIKDLGKTLVLNYPFPHFTLSDRELEEIGVL